MKNNVLSSKPAPRGSGLVRNDQLVVRFSPAEMQELEALAGRYAAKKGTKATKTQIIRLGLERMLRSYPAPKQA